jgi:hypothetical protein
MGKWISYIIVLLLSFTFTKGQNAEIGVFGGGSNYFGDLNRHTSFRKIDMAAGGLYRLIYNKYLLTKTSFIYGRVGFSDQLSDNPWQQARNLSFESYIFELSHQLEFNFFGVDIRKMETRYTPYLLAGVSLFQFKPVTNYQGQTYELRALGTEGQNTPAEFTPNTYSYTQLAFPIGGGFRYRLSPHWNINIEVGLRKTVTDYLDDVGGTYPDEHLIRRYNQDNPEKAVALSDRSRQESNNIGNIPGKQRGEKSNKDDYLFVGVMVTYTFWDLLCPTPKKL